MVILRAAMSEDVIGDHSNYLSNNIQRVLDTGGFSDLCFITRDNQNVLREFEVSRAIVLPHSPYLTKLVDQHILDPYVTKGLIKIYIEIETSVMEVIKTFLYTGMMKCHISMLKRVVEGLILMGINVDNFDFSLWQFVKDGVKTMKLPETNKTSIVRGSSEGISAAKQGPFSENLANTQQKRSIGRPRKRKLPAKNGITVEDTTTDGVCISEMKLLTIPVHRLKIASMKKCFICKVVLPMSRTESIQHLLDHSQLKSALLEAHCSDNSEWATSGKCSICGLHIGSEKLFLRHLSLSHDQLAKIVPQEHRVFPLVGEISLMTQTDHARMS